MFSLTPQDLNPMWQQVQAYLPMFLGIFGIAGAIGIAVAIGQGLPAMISKALKSAFGGGGR